MKQYCRYCAYLHVNNFPYCDVKEKELSENYTKSVNHCEEFQFNEVDAYGGIMEDGSLGPVYKPRKPKQSTTNTKQMILW